MSAANEDAVADVLTDIARRLGGAGSPEDLRSAIVADMRDKELQGDDVPRWLVDLLRAVRDDVETGWVDLDPGGDRTAVVDFLRHPPAVLPVDVRDDVESLTVVFGPLEREATVSWEGGCYRVAAAGHSWDDVDG